MHEMGFSYLAMNLGLALCKEQYTAIHTFIQVVCMIKECCSKLPIKPHHLKQGAEVIWCRWASSKATAYYWHVPLAQWSCGLLIKFHISWLGGRITLAGRGGEIAYLSEIKPEQSPILVKEFAHELSGEEYLPRFKNAYRWSESIWSSV